MILYQAPDPTLEDASLPANRDKFIQSQTMFSDIVGFHQGGKHFVSQFKFADG